MQTEPIKDTPTMPEQVDFSGRVVVVWMKSPSHGGVVENVSVRKIADRTFLLCQRAERESGTHDLWAGFPCWLALDEIQMMIELPDLQTAQRHYAQWKARKQSPQESKD